MIVPRQNNFLQNIKAQQIKLTMFSKMFSVNSLQNRCSFRLAEIHLFLFLYLICIYNLTNITNK